MKKIFVLAALLTACFTTAAWADPVRIRIGWAQVPTQITPLVAELAKTRPALFPNLNKSYTYEPVRFQGSPPQIQAFAAGEIEVAAFGPSALALSVTNAHLDPRVIADIAQDGDSHGYYSTWWAVKKDSPIKTLADVKGHTAIVNAKGASTDGLAARSSWYAGKSEKRHSVAWCPVSSPVGRPAIWGKSMAPSAQASREAASCLRHRSGSSSTWSST